MPFTLHKIIALSIFILLAFTIENTRGQQKLLEVPLEMRDKPWLDNEEHTLWGHSVTMLSGEKHTRYRHMNVGEFTTTK